MKNNVLDQLSTEELLVAVDDRMRLVKVVSPLSRDSDAAWAYYEEALTALKGRVFAMAQENLSTQAH